MVFSIVGASTFVPTVFSFGVMGASVSFLMLRVSLSATKLNGTQY